VVERVRVEGHISTPETRAELNRLVEHAWPTVFGTRRRVDIAGIDGNAWTDDVLDWAKQFPKSRVLMVRGVPGDNQPALALVRKERRRDGKLVKYQGRFFNVGTYGLKGGLYKFLRVAEPEMRGYVDFPAGLDDDYYEQLTAEKRTPKTNKKGFTVYEWTKPRSARNEQLDCMVYGEALAMKAGWRTLTPVQWAALAAEREVAGAHPDQNTEAAGHHPTQLGLWSAPLPPVAAVPQPGAMTAPPAPSSPAKPRVYA
jgi:phage terminase large subunit GpA-like protein